MMKRFAAYACLLPIGLILVLAEGDMLFRLQEQGLFMHTPLFFQQHMVSSGGMLTWAGAFLTQFFYYPALGTALLCLLWALLMWLLRRTFRLSTVWMPMTLVPIACLLLTVVDLGYWVYYLKLPGHAFCATLGIIISVSLTWLYRVLPRKYGISTLFILLTAVVGYPLFGFYGLLAVALMGILSWHADSHRLTDIIVALLSIIFVPLLCYYLLYHETNIVNIYWTALPVFAMRGERFMSYNLPYLAVVVCCVVMAVTYRRNRGNCPAAQMRTAWKKRVQAVVLAATAICVCVFWYKDANFHAEMSMLRNVEEQDWEAVLQKAKGLDNEPTRAICMMKNLALFRLGRQGDELFHYPEGAKRPNAPFPMRMVQTVGKRLYLEYGIPNYCYRWCMEDGVEYGWTVEKLKLMTLCSLLNGETTAAQRFINMLKKTDFHQSWARCYETFIHNNQLTEQDTNLQAIADIMRHDSFLTSDVSQIERFLIEHFSTAENSSPQLQEQTLLAAMLTKNMNLFWRQFYLYTERHLGEHVPVHYQEAACLIGHLMNIDVSYMPFDQQVVTDYQYISNAIGQKQPGDPSLELLRQQLYDRFHKTYYYYFYFNQYDFIEQ